MEARPLFEKFPRLDTERLTLRKLSRKDGQALLGILSNAEVAHLTDMDTIQELKEAEGIIDWGNKRFKRGQAIRWAIVRTEDGQLIGTCGFVNWVRHQGSRAELGYELGADYWGQGYMGEALEAVLAFGFGRMSLNRVEAMISPQNTRSEILLRKLGFQMEGILREHGYCQGSYRDEACYALLQREWLEGQMARKGEHSREG